MSGLNKKILALALLMAFVTSLLLYVYLSGLKGEQAEVEYIEIYAAKSEIPARTEVKEEMLVKVKMPKDVGIPLGLSDKSMIIGKLTKDRILEGEPILAERLYDGSSAQMSYIIPKGKRAVTIGVNEVSEVGNFILPGDYADVIATFDEASVDLNGRKIYYPKYTKVILQNVQILGVGQNMGVEKKEGGELPVSVTLAVTLEEAEKLVLADESGVLRLALKPFSDSTKVQTNGVIKDDLVIPKGRTEY